MWEAQERQNGRQVAIKKIFDAFSHPSDARRTEFELKVLQECTTNPHIITLIDSCLSLSKRDCYLVLEFMEFNLHTAILHGVIAPHDRGFIMHQVVLGLLQLHQLGVAHCDLTPSSVLLDKQCRVALSGLSSVQPFTNSSRSKDCLLATDDGADESVPSFSFSTSPRSYSPPEWLLGGSTIAASADVWSLGCVFWEMLHGTVLFPGLSTIHQLSLILGVLGMPSPNDVESISSQYTEEILRAVNAFIDKELSSSYLSVNVSSNPLDSDARDLLFKCVCFSPNKRISCEELINHPYLTMHKSSQKKSKEI